MSLPPSFLTASNVDRRKEKEEQKRKEREKQQYDPTTCDRELNPYWKDGGDGLPKFKKPEDSDDEALHQGSGTSKDKSKWKKSRDEDNYDKRKSEWRKHRQDSSDEDSGNCKKETKYRKSNWRKPRREDKFEKDRDSYHRQENRDLTQRKMEDRERSFSPKQKSINLDRTDEKGTEEKNEAFTEKELNQLAAKIVKAEIMGKTELASELKNTLEKARNNLRTVVKDETVILTRTDVQGRSQPVRLQSEYGESSSHKRKHKVDTHQDGQRVRYFADDDKYSLKQMFENEKYNSVEDSNREFLDMTKKIRKNDDLDDIFADNIRKKDSDAKIDSRNRDKAIAQYEKQSKSIDNCTKCLQSESMPKHLMISIGDTVYLSLPSYEPITTGHSLIIPVRHVPCSTQLDENEWSDLLDIRRALVKMFRSKNQDVIFFESAIALHRFPHMFIECVPVPEDEGAAAPIYFKKAIDECEIEWAQNKKLVTLKGRDVRKAIPKGLPYFTVSFGMEEGYAHVIEDEKLFPLNFAQEIIGGMLDLHHSKWRKPKKQSFEEQSKRVLQFSKEWSKFDCTTRLDS